MRGLLFLIPVSLIFLMHSCRTVRTVPQPPPVIDTTVVVETPPEVKAPDHAHADSMEFIRNTYKAVLGNRIGFTSFSGKIDLDYDEAGGKDYNVNVHVRMYKDSVIWISVNAILGIEALRVRITPDSVKLLDKQNKQYTARSISYLQELTALPLDLSALQDLLLGNPVFLDSNIVSYAKNGNTIALNSIGNSFSNLFTVGEADKLVQQSRLDDLDKVRNRSCSLLYADYENKKAVNFATKRNIEISDKKKLTIKMDFKQYDFNEKLSFPFPVPKNYSQN